MSWLGKFFLVTAVIALSSISSYALFGIGAYGGLELSTVDTTSSRIVLNRVGDFRIVDQNQDTINMGSLELGLVSPIENPIKIGGQIFFELPAIPITILFSGGAAFSTYDVYYGVVPASGFNPATEKREIHINDLPYFKGNAAATLKWTVFDSPLVPLKPYVAAGVGYEFLGPILADYSIYEGQDIAGLVQRLYTSAEPVGPQTNPRGEPNTLDYAIIEEFTDVIIENAAANARIFYNAGAGVKIKFPLIPIAIKLDYRANFAGDQDFLPSMSHTFFGSLSFNI